MRGIKLENKGPNMFEKFKTPSELIPSDPRFGCGPSLIPLEFIDALRESGVNILGTSHRKAPVKNLVKEVQEGLSKYFSLPEGYEVVVGNGGATFLFDMIAMGLVRKKAHHFTCGEFSSKWFKSSKALPWIDAEETSVEFGQGLDAKNIDGADMVAMTLNETSTGVMNTYLPEVDDITLLAIDATSGAGQIACDISKTDVFFFSPQKVFASEGGLFVTIMSPKALKRAMEINEDKSRYIAPIMNWKTAIDNSVKNQTYNTPSLTTLFFLNEQVKLMNKLGYGKVCEMATEKGNLLYSWASEKDYLSPYIQDEKHRSNAVATIDVKDGIDVNALLKVLESEGSVVGIDAYRKLGRNQFRISLFHNVTKDNLEKLTKLLSLAIESE